MVVKMFKKILTRKKAHVSNRKYTKKYTKTKSKKVGGEKRKRENNANTRSNSRSAPRSGSAARTTPVHAPRPDSSETYGDDNGVEEEKNGRTTPPPYVPTPTDPPRGPAAASDPPAAASDPPAAGSPPTVYPPEDDNLDKKKENAQAEYATRQSTKSNTTSSSTQATEDEIKRETEAAQTRENVKRQEDAANKAAERQDKALQAELTNLSKQNSDLTNKDGKTPERANMESNLKFNEPLPMLMKTFKKAKVNPGDKSEYFNLDNDSLKKLINYWYGNKRGFFDKVLRGLGVTGPPVPIAEWDVSQVTNMSYLFTEAKDFNENISSWNVSNVQSMAYMFYESDRFSQNINDWDVGNVRNMRGMFQRSQKFNSYLDQWDTGRVLDMRDMFKDSRKFNRNIDTWNVSNVRNMERMFENTAYNKPLASWNVMSVVNMAGMFRNNVKFNQPLANWGSSLKSIKNLDLFLHNAKSFNQDLSDWNLSKIGVPESMLFGTTVRQEFYPIGQRVNTQSQNMGLTPSEEKRAREKQVNAQVKADLRRLEDQQIAVRRSYLKQKSIHDEKLKNFKNDLILAQKQFESEMERKISETDNALMEEKDEALKNKELLGKLGVSVEGVRSVRETAGDLGKTGRPAGVPAPAPGAADPKSAAKGQYRFNSPAAYDYLRSIGKLDRLTETDKSSFEKVAIQFLKANGQDANKDNFREKIQSFSNKDIGNGIFTPGSGKKKKRFNNIRGAL